LKQPFLGFIDTHGVPESPSRLVTTRALVSLVRSYLAPIHRRFLMTAATVAAAPFEGCADV